MTTVATAFDAPLVAPVVDSPEVRTATNLRSLGVVMVGGAAVMPFVPAVGPLCPLRRMTGVPCPFCGMTTGVSTLVRGDIVGAFAANPLAPLFVVAVVLAWGLYLFGRPALPVRTRTIGTGITAALPGLWLFEMHRYDII